MKKTLALALLGIFLLVLTDAANAGKLQLPKGMGGVPDIGVIPCEVFTNMIKVGPLGTKRLLLTWAEGYYYARTGKTIDEILAAAEQAGETWDFTRLTGHFEAFCAANPEALTSAAVVDLGAKLYGTAP